MPCRVESDYEISQRWYDEANNLIGLLCQQCRALEENNQGRLMTAEVAAWWEQHQEVDRKRVALEKIAAEAERERLTQKKAALDKLTPSERKLLGV